MGGLRHAIFVLIKIVERGNWGGGGGVKYCGKGKWKLWKWALVIVAMFLTKEEEYRIQTTTGDEHTWKTCQEMYLGDDACWD